MGAGEIEFLNYFQNFPIPKWGWAASNQHAHLCAFFGYIVGL